jgi:hypothetical protein
MALKKSPNAVPRQFMIVGNQDPKHRDLPRKDREWKSEDGGCRKHLKQGLTAVSTPTSTPTAKPGFFCARKT